MYESMIVGNSTAVFGRHEPGGLPGFLCIGRKVDSATAEDGAWDGP